MISATRPSGMWFWLLGQRPAPPSSLVSQDVLVTIEADDFLVMAEADDRSSWPLTSSAAISCRLVSLSMMPAHSSYVKAASGPGDGRPRVSASRCIDTYTCTECKILLHAGFCG